MRQQEPGSQTFPQIQEIAPSNDASQNSNFASQQQTTSHVSGLPSQKRTGSAIDYIFKLHVTSDAELDICKDSAKEFQ